MLYPFEKLFFLRRLLKNPVAFVRLLKLYPSSGVSYPTYWYHENDRRQSGAYDELQDISLLLLRTCHNLHKGLGKHQNEIHQKPIAGTSP